ncbi:MAG: Rhomboid family protein, partial [uncultured Nocardioides sp.]
ERPHPPARARLLGQRRDLDRRLRGAPLGRRDHRHRAGQLPRRRGHPARHDRRPGRHPLGAAAPRRIRPPGLQHRAAAGARVHGPARRARPRPGRHRDRVGGRRARHVGDRRGRDGPPRRLGPRLRLADVPAGARVLHPPAGGAPRRGRRLPRLRRRAPRRAARDTRRLVAGAPLRRGRRRPGRLVARLADAGGGAGRLRPRAVL